MSDAVCRVADMADGIRMLHPDGSYRSAASEACQAIGLLVEQLNTTLGLYDASVREAECDGSVSGREKMDRIDRRVLNLFIADFEMSGVQLQDPIRRANFVSAAETALAIGADFVNMSHTPVSVRLSDSPSGLEDNPVQLTSPLSSEPHPNIRMLAYKAYYSPILGQEQRLTDLIEARHRMAYAAGFANFAERSTQHSIAQTPELVYQFLHTVCRRLRPYAAYSAREHLIPAVREADSRFVDCKPKIPSAGPRLWPWDVGYSLSLNRHIALTNELIDYFSLGACMEGVSQLATCLFGLQLRVEPTQPGETWHPQVLKVGVYRTEGGCGQHGSESIGTVYCDLLDRPGKPVQVCLVSSEYT
ncbi:unnamed protein product [Dicrocoelium dendriticum]|nr:unnamed protein product [Dicrocoelium dendriticum]